MPRRAVVALALAAACVCATAGVAVGAVWTSAWVGSAPVVAVDADGRAIVAATRADRVTVVRLLADGRVDPSFGEVAVFGGASPVARGVGTGPDGTVLVGVALGGDGAGVARISASGRLLSSAVVADGVDVRDAVVDPAGRMVLAGASGRAPWVLRVGDRGLTWSATGDPVEAVAARPDGAVVVARGASVEQVEPDGSSAGAVEVPFAPRALAVDREGRVLAGGDGLVRIGERGDVDTGFVASGLDEAVAVAVRCDGGIATVGGALVRFAADGGRGLSLATAGLASDVAAAPDGSLVVAGTAGDAVFAERVDGAPCAARALAAPVPVGDAAAGGIEEPVDGVVAVTHASRAEVPFVPAPARRARAATTLRGAFDAVRLPAERRCVAGRRLAVRIDVPRGAAVVDVTLSVDGRRAAVRRGRGRWSTATLRRLPRRAFTVEAAVRLADETTLRAARRYRPCR